MYKRTHSLNNAVGDRKNCQEIFLVNELDADPLCYTEKIPSQGECMPVFAGECLLLGADLYAELNNWNQNIGERVVV